MTVTNVSSLLSKCSTEVSWTMFPSHEGKPLRHFLEYSKHVPMCHPELYEREHMIAWQITSLATCGGALQMLLGVNGKSDAVLPVAHSFHFLQRTAAAYRQKWQMRQCSCHTVMSFSFYFIVLAILYLCAFQEPSRYGVEHSWNVL